MPKLGWIFGLELLEIRFERILAEIENGAANDLLAIFRDIERLLLAGVALRAADLHLIKAGHRARAAGSPIAISIGGGQTKRCRR